MRQTVNEAFNKATHFMATQARPLEQARFKHAFFQGDREDILNELQAFQNEDGGFGHGLEPDFWLPDSSPMATWAAARILYELDVDHDHPMVQKMVAYLVKTRDADTGMWPAVLPGNNDHPHAPWWHWRENVQDNWMFNPGAELAGYLVHWSNERSQHTYVGWASIEKAVRYMMDKQEMDSHEVCNFLHLLTITAREKEQFHERFEVAYEDVYEKVMKLAVDCVDQNTNTWATSYTALPLDFIDGPEHPLCERFGSLIEHNLDMFVKQINKNGVWDISWEWGSYPETFAIAKVEWQGILAIERYQRLEAFGYLK
ncbi:hypothetical protein [Lentibacillus saliphilus]|uniref:hypothetical protein n=1 Tax=Lentibacillus saliphilus TaxID=2737028 RepID=UPI001C2F5FA8|nr:hypothetical protein [Lentibacillus saliphilus]